MDLTPSVVRILVYSDFTSRETRYELPGTNLINLPTKVGCILDKRWDFFNIWLKEVINIFGKF